MAGGLSDICVWRLLRLPPPARMVRLDPVACARSLGRRRADGLLTALGLATNASTSMSGYDHATASMSGSWVDAIRWRPSGSAPRSFEVQFSRHREASLVT